MRMLIYEKNSTMMTVLLLQHRHISSSNKRDESHNEREKEGDEIFVFIRVVHEWNLRWFKKKGTITDVSYLLFNAIENTHGFFFKGNDDDGWRMAAVNDIL